MESAFMQVFAVGVAVAVAPGPDFFMVLRNSLSRGRLAGIMTALGIGTALVVHVIYSVLGLALIIASSPATYGVIRACGALYLVDPEKLLKRHVRHRPARAEHWAEVYAQGI